MRLDDSAVLRPRGEHVEPLVVTPTIEGSAAGLWRATLDGRACMLLADTLDDDGALLVAVT